MMIFFLFSLFVSLSFSHAQERCERYVLENECATVFSTAGFLFFSF